MTLQPGSVYGWDGTIYDDQSGTFYLQNPDGTWTTSGGGGTFALNGNSMTPITAGQPPPPPQDYIPPPSDTIAPTNDTGTPSGNSFSWGGKTWSYGDLAAFKAYLGTTGVSYSTWAGNHPGAAALLTTAPTSTTPSDSTPPSATTPTDNTGGSATSFTWGDRSWGAGDLEAFKAYLGTTGVSFATWAANHPGAAALLTDNNNGQETTPHGGPGTGAGNPPGTDPITVTIPGDDPGGTGTGTGGGSGGGSGGGDGGTGGGTGTGGGSGLPIPDAPTDWASLLGQYGLPPDVIAQLNDIWTKAGGDVSQAVILAQAYVRGTQWYATTYPGIQAGINAGLFSDEQGYRAYQNQVNQLYTQYYGRAATSSEVSQYITSGKSVGQISNGLQSDAFLGTLSDPLKALFTTDELKALADEQAGTDTALGQKVLQQANLATSVGSLYKDFYGRPITRGELDALTAEGSDANTVARQFATQANISAMNPAISALFTPDEIQQMALQAAGGTTANGEALQNMAALASQLNQVYQTYHGTSVTRDELNQAYQQGYSAQQVANALQTGTVLSTLPQYLGGLFTPDELSQIAQQQSGQSNTPQGALLASLASQADSYNQVFQQFMGRNVSRDELAQYVNAGTSASQVAAGLQAGQFSAALPTSVSGLFTPDELLTAGKQQSGAESSPEGQRLLNQIQQAGAYNAVANQYTGAPIQRSQLDNFYNQGVSASTYAAQQQGHAFAQANQGDIQQTSSSFGDGNLTSDQLDQLGQEATGYDTPEGAKLLAAFNKAQTRAHGVFTGSLAATSLRLPSALKASSPDVAA